MIRQIILLGFMLMAYSSVGQEGAGLLLGNYSGINALNINPSFAFKSENKWDLRLAGAHAFANTDYAKISNANLIKLLKDDSEVLIPTVTNDVVPDETDMVVDFKEQGGSSIHVKGEVLGPGLMFSLSDKLKIGASARFRMIGGSNGIPEVFNFNNFEDTNMDSIYTVAPFELGGMGWSEYSVHYAQKINDKLSFGASLKFLRGNSSAYVKNEFDFDLRESDMDANVAELLENGQFTLAYFENWPEFIFSGSGVGLDLGVSFDELMGSKFQLGVSVLDLGFVAFNGTHSDYSVGTGQLVSSADYEDLQDIDALKGQLDQDFISVSKTGYNMQLPTALAIQGSLAASKNLAIEGYWVQRVTFPFSETASYRANSINLTTIYDRKHFSAFLPITLYDYSDLRIGTALRFGFLTIGSDKVSSLFLSKDFSGTDLYANVVIYPFQLWGKKKFKGGDKGGTGCYDWGSL